MDRRFHAYRRSPRGPSFFKAGLGAGLGLGCGTLIAAGLVWVLTCVVLWIVGRAL